MSTFCPRTLDPRRLPKIFVNFAADLGQFAHKEHMATLPDKKRTPFKRESFLTSLRRRFHNTNGQGPSRRSVKDTSGNKSRPKSGKGCPGSKPPTAESLQAFLDSCKTKKQSAAVKSSVQSKSPKPSSTRTSTETNNEQQDDTKAEVPRKEARAKSQEANNEAKSIEDAVDTEHAQPTEQSTPDEVESSDPCLPLPVDDSETEERPAASPDKDGAREPTDQKGDGEGEAEDNEPAEEEDVAPVQSDPLAHQQEVTEKSDKEQTEGEPDETETAARETDETETPGEPDKTETAEEPDKTETAEETDKTENAEEEDETAVEEQNEPPQYMKQLEVSGHIRIHLLHPCYVCVCSVFQAAILTPGAESREILQQLMGCNDSDPIAGLSTEHMQQLLATLDTSGPDSVSLEGQETDGGPEVSPARTEEEDKAGDGDEKSNASDAEGAESEDQTGEEPEAEAASNEED